MVKPPFIMEVLMFVRVKRAYTETSEKSRSGEKISVLYANGMYSLSVGRWWVVENKKTLRPINVWLDDNGYETRFVKEED